ncbi:hypothetical protein ANCDUO_16318 [Ancylostoma duodenale]|uniref:Uncharacterized protein n=1 Tax=Ancylostoma duodenale TaxID=51022 RepID=A0A0C2G3R6_9BILA|nr:hypothetical protein ANCDUO_16318 [Ancylostoma duodenale]
MTYDYTRLPQDFSDDVTEEAPRTKASSLSRASSFDSIDQDAPFNDYFSSDELDKLSSCLSEVSKICAVLRGNWVCKAHPSLYLLKQYA